MTHSFAEVSSFLAAPFVMCLILVGIHCYLGLHVLARGVIFVDLSLAQVAALGSTVAFAIGFEHQTVAAYFIALASTFLAALLFALARSQEKKIPQEAVIGIIYAFASAAVVIVVDKIAHGAEHIKDILIGQVLWVNWHDVGKTFIIYSSVSVVHFVFRKQFLRVSFGQEQSRAVFWDFLFYALFGVVITSSVSLAGVLQVFAYLIVPASVASFFFESVKARLLFGWAFGVVMSLVGMVMSYFWDMPAGAFIVVLFAFWPVALLILSSLRAFFK